MRIGPAVDASRAAAAGAPLWVSYHDTEPRGRPAPSCSRAFTGEGNISSYPDGGPAAEDTSAERKAFEITRDYTMYERTEAPQDYPAVTRHP